ncbi:PEP-CTERM sorting domain-containing protein [Thalassotalea sp. PLHSN55]|uniref:PEP-CTERM sorting domain-containing protein n=1 Tax=Thalassotalea sp. PLHSN55 TaxID=3435888 RepID=UPI003F8764D7
MSKVTIKSLIATLVLTVSCSASAALITQEFNNGDSLADWGVDRAAPTGFEIINNELVMSITGPADSDDFRNTQGMKLDIGESTFMSVDMFIDSSWANDERYGGFWSVAYDSADVISAYPILEFQGQNNGVVAAWDNSGWAEFSTLFNFDEFNTFSFEINDLGVDYSINGVKVHSDTTSDIQYFGDVILNAKYEGSDFTVKYDNLTFGSVDVPEPSTLAILALGLVGFASRKVKK